MKLPYAEYINYWKTSKSTPDVWLDRAEKVIEELGGQVSVRAKGKTDGKTAFLMEFTFSPEKFRIVWPVLPSERGDTKAAERQAATLLYHDVKARSLRASVFGNKAAFFDFMKIKDGRTISQLTSPEIIEYLPKMLTD